MQNFCFVAHRKEILEQALITFRNVLRDQNFGELLSEILRLADWNTCFARYRC